MRNARLETRDGSLVTKVLIPPYKPEADAILWGSRYFFITDTTFGERNGDMLRIYREGIIAIPMESDL